MVEQHVVFMYILSFIGDDVDVDQLLPRLIGKINVVKSYRKGKVLHFSRFEFEAESSIISIGPPKEYIPHNEIEEYETWIVDILRSNYGLLFEAGLKDIEIAIDIFYEGDQCNFEIFDKEKLKIIANYGVSMPISVHHITYDKLKKLLLNDK